MDNYSLRRVSKKDENLILLWANDKDTRESSFNSEIIKKSEHNKWLKKKLEDLNTCMWIFEHNHIPSGLVRFEKINDDAVLNYQISPDKRRKGFASIIEKDFSVALLFLILIKFKIILIDSRC